MPARIIIAYCIIAALAFGFGLGIYRWRTAKDRARRKRVQRRQSFQNLAAGEADESDED